MQPVVNSAVGAEGTLAAGTISASVAGSLEADLIGYLMTAMISWEPGSMHSSLWSSGSSEKLLSGVLLVTTAELKGYPIGPHTDH